NKMQKASYSVAPNPPILILLPDSGESPPASMSAHGPRILGLALARRTALAADRAGYGPVYAVNPGQAAPSGITAISRWTAVAGASAVQPRPLIIAHAAILGEPEWLTQLARTRIDPAKWAAKPHKIIVIAATAADEALAILDADNGTYDLTAVEERLTRRFGSPADLHLSNDPMVVATPADVDAAEWRLLRGLVKDTDGFMARHVERPISLRIARRLASTAITPNQVTLLSVGIGLCGAPFFLSADWLWQTIGALLFLAHSILDGCDGELARLRFQESRLGGIIDYWGDNVVHIVIFACIALGWSLSITASWPLLLGLAAGLGNLGSASFVYWRVMRPKKDDGPLFTSVAAVPGDALARMLDAASRRDFIYLVLFL